MNIVTKERALPSAQARAELAPHGTLRLAFPQASALYVTRDPASGQLRGLSMDLGTELAARLGVPFEAKPYKAVRELIADTGQDQWDVATIVMEDDRRKMFDYSRAYLEADSTYLVPAGSPIGQVGDADKPQIRIGVAENSAFDLFLTRAVKQAVLVRFGGVGAAFDGLQAGACDLVAAPRQVLATAQGRFAGSRILDDWFDRAFVGIAVPKGRQAAGLAFVNAYLAEAIASGFIAQAIARAGMKGAKVAAE
ncbi:MAG TPA: transporter substrate-binding domain-containing protein [Pseudolabrys sp.]|nr:transporter substrate-binding domain-containing protein [Pseudolabrys sp.]